MTMTYMIRCRVQGGVTGKRESILKHNGGQIHYFSSHALAQAEADRLNKAMNHEHAKARFEYWPVPVVSVEYVNYHAAAEPMYNALSVIALDPKISAWLAANDPMALKQVDEAIRLARPEGVPPQVQERAGKTGY